ncbi:MAG TPA: chromosome partitioning protein ParB, partial [Bacteroidales bacterium]|nr:chromosome partitioning protein ParB [Bacteroidales bacterium]
ELKSRLTRLFDTRVKLVSDDKGKGKIIIPFKDDDELSRIMGLLDHIDKN